MTENTETQPTAEEIQAETSALALKILDLVPGQRVDVVMGALTGALIALASDTRATESDRKVRAGFIVQRALYAADAAKMDTDELTITVAATLDLLNGAAAAPEEAVAGMAALMSAADALGTEH